jgi:hypothetical protein
MDDPRSELVRIDGTGTAHPVGRTASQRMRAREGAFRLMPAPAHLVVMRYVGEDGRRDDADGPVFRLAGEITSDGALCDIVALVGQAGWGGELVVLDGAASRSIFFEAGNVIGASSTSPGERIGEVLYKYGALTAHQVGEVVAASSADARFGEVAVRLGFLTNERLFQLISMQAQEILFAVLRVGDGMFYFLETYDATRLAARLSLGVNGLLMEGVRRMDEMRFFRQRIPSEEHVPERVAGRGEPAAELAAVLAAVDGARSVTEIGRIASLGEFEVTQAIFQLVQSGHVVVHAPRPTGPAAIAAIFNQIMATLLAELDTGGTGDAVREQLASFATSGGMYVPLFDKAGPARDGTVDADRLAENAVRLVGAEQTDASLAQWLHEYASFALFLAEPHLRRSDAPPKSTVDAPPLPAKRVGELLAALAGHGG